MGKDWRTSHRFETFQLTRRGHVEALNEKVDDNKGNDDCEEKWRLNRNDDDCGGHLEGRVQQNTVKRTKLM